jgi:hypothetical protein
MSPQEAGQRLHGDAVLAGSVRRVDRKVRVNAQLIRTADDQDLWAEGGLEFEGRDLLETEKMLASAIATRLRAPLSRQRRIAMLRSPTSSSEAYEHFVRGTLALRNSAADHSLVAEQLLQRAVHLQGSPHGMDSLPGEEDGGEDAGQESCESGSGTEDVSRSDRERRCQDTRGIRRSAQDAVF